MLSNSHLFNFILIFNQRNQAHLAKSGTHPSCGHLLSAALPFPTTPETSLPHPHVSPVFLALRCTQDLPSGLWAVVGIITPSRVNAFQRTRQLLPLGQQFCGQHLFSIFFLFFFNIESFYKLLKVSVYPVTISLCHF